MNITLHSFWRTVFSAPLVSILLAIPSYHHTLVLWILLLLEYTLGGLHIAEDVLVKRLGELRKFTHTLIVHSQAHSEVRTVIQPILFTQLRKKLHIHNCDYVYVEEVALATRNRLIEWKRKREKERERVCVCLWGELNNTKNKNIGLWLNRFTGFIEGRGGIYNILYYNPLKGM